MSNKLYMVIMDGWNEGYGTEIYLVGVFYLKEWAEKVMEEEQLRCPNANFELIEIEPNITYYSKPYEKGSFAENSFKTDVYLGGYME